ncbi:MAG TPA: tRNA lysidine(34) synthetase TilS [Elusimicrobiota bacterium]|nr:tRNA lysidine(34) synthetase TilS [Elusimicrobiota bacterium]
MPAPKRVLSELAAFDRREGLLRRGDRVLAAVSGGPDSVCLAHRLARLSGPRGLRVELIHFDHGLRGEAARRDERFCRALAERLGLPYHARQLPVARAARAQRRSLEDAGRVLRYRALASEARRLGLDTVAVGHHLDDQAETLILHLLRGTKAKGLAGIPPSRPLADGVRLVRPLLGISRADVLTYLRAYGLRFRRDASNREERFTRNWVRLRILPILESRSPRLREHLAALAADVRALLKDSGPGSPRRAG